ncbi:hypothetical protein GL213_03415 [Halogeometricum borinquense]|nr:hypothetical protein [Halogeometricum borinquense]QIQ75056.1 hypothetical protein GL213_03415 [Halogeometricum borinquense]
MTIRTIKRFRLIPHEVHATHCPDCIHDADAEPGTKQHILQYIRGNVENETMDIYTRVNRAEVREAYLDCIKSLGL